MSQIIVAVMTCLMRKRPAAVLRGNDNLSCRSFKNLSKASALFFLRRQIIFHIGSYQREGCHESWPVTSTQEFKVLNLLNEEENGTIWVPGLCFKLWIYFFNICFVSQSACRQYLVRFKTSYWYFICTRLPNVPVAPLLTDLYDFNYFYQFKISGN